MYLKYLEILASERVNLYLTGTAVETGSWLGIVTADWRQCWWTDVQVLLLPVSHTLWYGQHTLRVSTGLYLLCVQGEEEKGEDGEGPHTEEGEGKGATMYVGTKPQFSSLQASANTEYFWFQ